MQRSRSTLTRNNLWHYLKKKILFFYTCREVPCPEITYFIIFFFFTWAWAGTPAAVCCRAASWSADTYWGPGRLASGLPPPGPFILSSWGSSEGLSVGGHHCPNSLWRHCPMAHNSGSYKFFFFFFFTLKLFFFFYKLGLSSRL